MKRLKAILGFATVMVFLVVVSSCKKIGIFDKEAVPAPKLIICQ